MAETELQNGARPGQAERPLLLGLPVDTTALEIPEALDSAQARAGPFLVTFVNPNACFVSENHPNFVNTLGKFDHISCDGIGMVVAARLRLGKRVPRQAFDTTSVAMPVLEWARTNQMPVVFVGGQDSVSSRAAAVLGERLEGLQVAGAFSGFGDGPIRAQEHIVAAGNCMVICGMGAPLQEQFLVGLVESGWIGIGFTCGGFLDQVCERFQYYPKWVDKLNLRFAYRLIREPRRLWRRYLVEYQVFLRRLIKELLGFRRS